MLARTFPRSLLAKPTGFLTGSFRTYSAAHGHEHHAESSHGHDEHHDDHGHHDHGPPLAESESILNSKTAIAAGIVVAIASYSYINTQYKASHNGEALTSIVSSKHSISQLTDNFQAYRNRVSLQKQIQEMMMFPGVEKRSYNNLVTSIDTVPGRLFPTGSNTQLNTIQDYSKLDARKVKSSPFI